MISYRCGGKASRDKGAPAHLPPKTHPHPNVCLSLLSLLGTMLGICASVQPLTRTVGPTIGGVLYKRFGVHSFGYLQLIVNIVLFVYLLKSKIPLREQKAH